MRSIDSLYERLVVCVTDEISADTSTRVSGFLLIRTFNPSEGNDYAERKKKGEKNEFESMRV